MGQQYDIKYLVETAIQNLLKANVFIAAQNINVSDNPGTNLQHPHINIVTRSNQEMKLGVMKNGDYASGVYKLVVDIELSIKGKQTTTQEAASIWQQIIQALHWQAPLASRLTSYQPQPFNCFYAMPGSETETADTERLLWKKTLPVTVIAMGHALP